jgi:cytochrome c-type biogenesis protein CcmH
MRIVVAVVIAAVVVAAPAAAACRHPASEDSVESQLICPTCHEPLDESNSPIAQDMKQQIQRLVAECKTEKQIIDWFVGPPNNFGPDILATPQKHGFDLLAWVIPLGVAIGGAAALAVGARRWTRARDDAAQPPVDPLDPELERLVDEELARFDG